MSCEIFTKPLLLDITNIDEANFDLSWLRRLIPPIDSTTSGIWQPIWINLDQSKGENVSPLFFARSNRSSLFSPCNCSDNQIDSEPLYADNSNIGLCNYCDSPNASNEKWSLRDDQGNVSPRSYDLSCCGGACDTMLKADDYIPKIPYLNHAYISGSADSKHHSEFPVCNNPYLGCEGFISHNNLDTINGAVLRTDWRIQETISEIPYDKFTSQHDSEFLHDISYQKSKNISSTCGNFIMLSLPDNATRNNFYSEKYDILQNLIFSSFDAEPNSKIPSIEDFKQMPYGFDRETYKNIFVNNKKIGSYWKWNPTSGILCWYRYLANETSESKTAAIKLLKAKKEVEILNSRRQTAIIAQATNELSEIETALTLANTRLSRAQADRSTKLSDAARTDQRPIPGIDLYISPGDVFFAKNDGPEPQSDLDNPFTKNRLITNCPSGLKILEGGDVSCIIPSGSNFAYISANIYPKFHDLYYKFLNLIESEQQQQQEEEEEGEQQRLLVNPNKEAFMLAATLATAPQYDEITVDLLKRTNNTNDYTLNIFKQIDVLNRDMLTETNYDSVSRLNYISNKTELFDTISKKYGCYLWIPPNSNTTLSFSESINASFATSLNFDISLKKSDTRWRNTSCVPINTCGERSFLKNFSYEQNIGYSLTSISTRINEDLRHSITCDNGNFSRSNYGFYSNTYLNNSLINSIYTSNGCSVFSGIYPRISQAGDTRFCRDCDKYSSFYLINNADQTECGNHSGISSFCYATLAFRLNNSPPPNMNRPERRLADGTKRLIRSYRGLFFNPYIDSVAFHQSNGVFVNSVPLKLDNYVAFEKNNTAPNNLSDNIYVNFNTKDVGIKIYDIELEYIQSQISRSFKCKRFPVKETCKCLPMISEDIIERPIDCDNPNINSISSSNIFTPGLSTRFSPRLQKYGGFSQNYLDTILGERTVSAGGFLPILTNFRSPLNPLKCDSSTSISLYNYTNTEWNIRINNLDNNSYFYVTANEDITITGPRKFAFVSSDGIRETPNPAGRRFTNKIVINGTNLYAGETKKLDNQQNLNISLQNPFLEQAILSAGGSANTILYPPSGKLSRSYVYSSVGSEFDQFPHRGNESTRVDLTFKQYFDITKLVFKIPPIKTMGLLTAGSFDPNKGLSSISDNKSPIKNNTIYYANELFDTNQLNQGKVYYGVLNEQVINSIKNLNEFDIHKKLRLYLKINNQWYFYTGSNIGSFLIENTKYPGKPTLFEYSRVEKSKNLPSVLVSPVKTHLDFRFINNKVRPTLNKKNANFPYLANDTQIYRRNNFDLQIPGLRHYFMIPEIDSSITLNIDSIKNIKDVNPNFAELQYGDAIKLADGTRWLCINPAELNKRSSYIYAPFTYLTQYFSDLSLDFTKISRNGYVYNSKKKCNFPIVTKTNNNIVHNNTVIEKSIYVAYKTKDGRNITNFNTEDLYIQTFTILKLANPVPNSVILLDIFSGQEYITVGQTNTPRSEQSQYLLNAYLPGKWGDVINYDKQLVDPIVSATHNIKDMFPKPSYNNLLFKTIVNNFSEEYLYKIFRYQDNKLDDGQIFHIPDKQGLIYYCVLNPYALTDNQSYSALTNKYNNFIPLMDINVLEAPASSLDIPNSGSGIINIANITETIDPNEDYLSYDEGPYFWFNTDTTQKNLYRTFVPTSNYYSDTLRIDNPIYWLDSIRDRNILFDSDTQYSAYFYPNRMSTNISINRNFINGSSFTFINASRNIPYWKYPIYGDKDDGTCLNSGCFGDSIYRISSDNGFDKAGEYVLNASYRIANNNDAPNLTSNSIEFAIGHDAGLYNIPLNSLPLIERFELKPDNIIDKNIDECSSSQVFPQNYDIRPGSPLFQRVLDSSTQKTYPVDLVANEMLFRILYGESQYINKKMFFVDNPVYSRQDLIGYSDPKLTPEDIYTQILYNYDKLANNSIKIDGAFSINGVLSIGSVTNIIINNVSIQLAIIRINDKIYIRYNSSLGQSEDILLYNERQTLENYIVQVIGPDEEEPPEPQPDNENSSIVYIDDYFGITGYTYGQLLLEGNAEGVSDRVNASSTWSTILDLEVVCPVNWTESYGRGNWNTGPGNCFDGSARISTLRNIPPTTLDFNWRQCVCGQNTVGRVNFISANYSTSDPPCRFLSSDVPYPNHINAGACTPFNLGFCRRADCLYCDETFDSKTEINFKYDWKYCRTNFSTFGHIYRELHSHEETTTLIPREQECSFESSDPCEFNENAPCNPIPYPIYIGSRQTTQDFYINNAWLGASTPDICGGPCCVPVVGTIPPCSEIEDQKHYTFCCRDLGDGCGCWGKISPGGCGAVLVPVDEQGRPTFSNPVAEVPSTPCYRGSMFSDCSIWLGPPWTFRQTSIGYRGGFGTQELCEDYCHSCGVQRFGNRDIYRYKVFKKTTTVFQPYQEGGCANLLSTVSYNNSSILININNKNICLNFLLDKCPNITINSTMQQLSVNDTINSNCDECLNSSLSITIPSQQMQFVTKTETRKCLLETFTSCDLNSKGLVGMWYFLINSGSGGDLDDGGGGRSAGWVSQCGGGTPEYGCKKIGQLLYSSDDPTYDITYECLEGGLRCDVAPRVLSYEIEERRFRHSLLFDRGKILPASVSRFGPFISPGNYFGEGASDIPLEEIIEGVVPGSVTGPILETYNDGGEKITRLGGIVEGIVTVYVFYYTYSYIRPVTIEDILRNDEDIVCREDLVGPPLQDNLRYLATSGGQCNALSFPSSYSFNFASIPWGNYFNTNSRAVSYTILNPNFEKDPCSNSVSCYYTNKVLICGQSPIHCTILNGLIKDEGMIPKENIIEGKIKPCSSSEYYF